MALTLRERLRRAAEASPLAAPLLQRYRAAKRAAHLRRFKNTLIEWRIFPLEQAQAIVRDYAAIAHSTQLGAAGILNLEQIARYVVAAKLAGAFVECGTWRGGALAYWARAFQRNGGDPDRHALYGFDSFEGMPNPTAADGVHGSNWLYGQAPQQVSAPRLSGALVGSTVNRAAEEDCRAVLAATGYPPGKFHVVKGWFQHTLPQWRERIGPIAVLRLDGDFYESTKTCLEQLFDQVVPGGVVINDDYGTFEGCRRAVDEWRAARPDIPPLLSADAGIRWLIKR